MPIAGRGPVCEERYEVSDQGRVRSRDFLVFRTVGTYLKRGQLMRQTPRREGHLHVGLSYLEPYRSVSARVHILVLETFVGPRSPGQECRHLNGDPADNRLANLAWGTSTENAQDTIRHGRNKSLRRTRCPRRHPLREPNLVPYKARKGHRVCLACARAMSLAWRLKNKGETPNFPALADAYFAEITAGAAA